MKWFILSYKKDGFISPQSCWVAGVARFGENQLHKALRKLHPEKSLDWADTILARMKLRAGLLIETKPEVYSFPHRTFQEYLAGCYLSTHANFTEKAGGLADQGAYWWDVILLAVGRMIHHGGDIDRPLMLAGELSPDEISEKSDVAVLRHVLLAGKIVVEIGLPRANRRKYGPQIIKIVRSNLATLISKGLLTPRERSDAADCLSQLKDPRPGVGVVDGLPDIQWVHVGKGPFIMGSDRKKDQDAFGVETPQFTCGLIERDFEISRYPITVAQYRAFCEDNGYLQDRYWTKAGWKWRCEEEIRKPEVYPGAFQLENHPQVGVNWYEATAYCNWLSEKSGETITLPTEAQWERSARHTDGRIYPWGDRFETGYCNTSETGLNGTSAVGIFLLSDAVCSAADMSGNVFEWCITTYRNDYQNYEKKVDNSLTTSKPRVLRGGCWALNRSYSRCAYRGGDDPNDRGSYLGFRCVRTN